MAFLSNRKRLILALDVDTRKRVEDLVDNLSEFMAMFKVGPRLFTKYGPPIIKSIQKRKGKVFYDAKFYDIPSVIEKAAQKVAEMQVDMLTLHTLGGSEMMEAAIKGAKKENEKIKVIGVTILTSLTSRIIKEELGIEKKVNEEVIHLANLAKKAGLDGVVSSPWEVEDLRKLLGEDFFLVVPGIRALGGEKNEQKRVASPREAIVKGADFLVIGRPILASSNPVEATKKILKEIGGEKDEKCYC
ncbi:MAG: orotidine-5'-phosphate decarboxylase [Candidatus Aerophobetes bacterium]|nr:orotidine-5'-phosphate decarboxylase [Candidatus Aerophobetes bacterium]